MILYKVEWPVLTWRGDLTGKTQHKYFETALGAISSAGQHGGTITQIDISSLEWTPFVNERYVVSSGYPYQRRQSTFHDLDEAKAWAERLKSEGKYQVRIQRLVTERIA